jgi:translation initiation factor 6
MKTVKKFSINSNFNVGLFAFATDSFCLVGNDILDKDIEVLHDVLKVPVHRISVAGTSLIGVFVVGNSKTILIPEITYPEERHELDRLGIGYEVIKTNLTALGNNMVCNDNGAIVNPEFKDHEIDEISSALGVKAVRGTVESLEIVGALCCANDKGCITSKNITNSESDLLSDVLKVTVYTGTVNLGNNYIHSGVIANSTGILVGSSSGGVEITDVADALSGQK